jgi:hypothetical protein
VTSRRYRAHWAQQPVFVLTTDIEWASDPCIDAFVAFARERGIVPTAFATHASRRLAAAADAGHVELGIHPNFLNGSSHGSTPADVIRHCLAFAPGAKVSRSHAFADGTHMALALRRAGIEVDSNVCLYLQQGLGILQHWTGIMRLPVFWEDDIHWMVGGTWRLSDYRDDFFSPGLKIINVHPFNFALNLADDASYQAAKSLIKSLTPEQAPSLRNRGLGTATLLDELCDAVARRGYGWHRLLDSITVKEAKAIG